jgi:hypothetical protein
LIENQSITEKQKKKNPKKVTIHLKISNTKKDIKIILVLSNKEKGKTHTGILKLYPLLIQLRLRKSKGGREFQLKRYKKHNEAGNNGIKNQHLFV